MRAYKYILGFFTVGFVLAFQAKISKVELYKAYFIAIQDVEIRNSQDLSISAILNSDYYFEDDAVPTPQNGGLLALASHPELTVYPPTSDWDLPISRDKPFSDGIDLLSVSPTRAP